MAKSIYKVHVDFIRHVHANNEAEAKEKIQEYIRRHADKTFIMVERVFQGEEFIDEDIE